MRLAYDCAANSPDPSCQNGAVVINPYNSLVGKGCNDFPSKIKEKYGLDWLLETRERKLFYIEHSERNAIFNAKCVDNCTLVCPWFACADCARAIALSGIKKVVGHRQRMDMNPPRWKESVDAGLDMLITMGVKLEFIDESIELEKPILVNGELMSKI